MTHHREAVCTSGYVGEFSFARLLRECRLPQVRFDNAELIEVAKQSSAGCKRLNQALPYLRSEYGTQYRTPEGKYRIKLVQLGANQQTIKEPKPYPYMST